MTTLDTKIFNQAMDAPFEQLDKVVSYIDDIKKFINWNTIGILSDESRKNLVILLFKDSDLLGTLRLNLNLEECVKSINAISENHQPITLRFWQGSSLQKEHLENLVHLKEIWDSCSAISTLLDNSQKIVDFLTEYFSDENKIGRGRNITTATKNKVWNDGHGRCMFVGCGESLRYEFLSGAEGNFSYLAHNVASAVNGERGIPYFSSILSDEPDNILLLCDKHHRLIDKVAAADFSASTLALMRKEFCDLAENLLDGLSFEAVPVYTILWPVNGQFVSNPQLKDIASSLSLLKSRIKGQERCLTDSNTPYRKKPEKFNEDLIELIRDEADQILQGTKRDGYKAALFAFGPMPALIGLGSLLGNKNEFTPMLRYRDSSSWLWPHSNVIDPFYEIKGLDLLTENDDVVICANFTAIAEPIQNRAQELKESVGAAILEITALPEYMGNGAIPNPESGRKFCARLQQLLHDLKNKHNTKRVHLLVCASNAACVFIGQAIDLHHPEIIVYDFAKETMVARLVIKNNGKTNELELPS
ncbi:MULTISPECIES: SAVED domain-containing protein [Acinetobacter]|jgi:hypothetical protein|uniref:SAVED domain-containing protein n=1 Tax=Acinetobacter TaxID=469 RepID=UPI00226E61BC|nr:SAVED domain-containing protein [Acinetobacter baumannii]MCY0274337.1 SAVED domain-containing protein [Acinetobacter baumannii]